MFPPNQLYSSPVQPPPAVFHCPYSLLIKVQREATPFQPGNGILAMAFLRTNKIRCMYIILPAIIMLPLRVINSKGCLNTLSKNQYIHVNPGANANFSNNVPNVCSAPVTINFQNLSTGAGVLTYEWLFGDGSGSALQNPSHIYTTPGSYTVKLIVTNASGCKDTLPKQMLLL